MTPWSQKNWVWVTFSRNQWYGMKHGFAKITYLRAVTMQHLGLYFPSGPFLSLSGHSEEVKHAMSIAVVCRTFFIIEVPFWIVSAQLLPAPCCVCFRLMWWWIMCKLGLVRSLCPKENLHASHMGLEKTCRETPDINLSSGSILTWSHGAATLPYIFFFIFFFYLYYYYYYDNRYHPSQWTAYIESYLKGKPFFISFNFGRTTI